MKPSRSVLLLFGGTIFLSSSLLFLIQPIFAKLILPWFGGSAAVWTTCLVFFQVALLAGYGYAHFIADRLPSRMQTMVHIALLGAALLLLPAIPSASWKPSPGANPTWRILGLLTVVLGLPYLLLSATSPLLQSWFARRWPDSRPYRLFALSNVAALLALASYPVWVEPNFATRAQDVNWSIAFGVFAVLCAAAAWLGRSERAIDAPAAPRPSTQQLGFWIALSAGGSMLLLSITNQITQNVAAVPFLWILPLVVYLLTFVLCFESSRWYKREIFLRLLAVGLGSAGYAISSVEESTAVGVALPLLLAALFFGCMYCHGELSAMKPEGGNLTIFYLMVALGGAIGAVFVGLLAPMIFSAVYELPVALFFVAILAVSLTWNSGWMQRLLWATISVAMLLVLVSEVRGYRQDAIAMDRSFYGALRVTQTPEMRLLFHGTILHGEEFLAPEKRRQPTSYYGPNSGIGLALRYHGAAAKRVGLIGLGAGTLAAYGRAGDDYRFYEINPQVIELANSQFYFLRDSAAHVQTILGDARLSLESEPPQGFDVLAVDAFSGDAIPVHLLTREAFALYFRHLKPEGILAVHVSNQFLDLAPVVSQLAAASGSAAVQIVNKKDEAQAISQSTWVLVTRDREIASVAEPIPPRPDLRLWTDDYNNLLQIFRWVP